MQEKSGVASSQPSLESQPAKKDLVDHKTEQSSSSVLSFQVQKPLEVAEDPACRDLIQATMQERGERLSSCTIL